MSQELCAFCHRPEQFTVQVKPNYFAEDHDPFLARKFSYAGQKVPVHRSCALWVPEADGLDDTAAIESAIARGQSKVRPFVALSDFAHSSRRIGARRAGSAVA